MSYTYDEPNGDGYEVCPYCDGTGGTCVTGECWECAGNGYLSLGLAWEYGEYARQLEEETRASIHDLNESVLDKWKKERSQG